MKVSKTEPAVRALMVSLSLAEVCALSYYHVREARSVATRFGKMTMRRDVGLSEVRAASVAAKAMVSAHQERARELAALLPSAGTKAKAAKGKGARS